MAKVYKTMIINHYSAKLRHNHKIEGNHFIGEYMVRYAIISSYRIMRKKGIHHDLARDLIWEILWAGNYGELKFGKGPHSGAFVSN